MKIKINKADLNEKKQEEINDKIKLGYSLKEINATLAKDTTVKQTWTKNQKTYLDGMENRLNTRIDSVEERLNTRIDSVEERLNTRIDSVEERLNARIDGVEERLNTRIDNLENTMINLFKLNGFKVK